MSNRLFVFTLLSVTILCAACDDSPDTAATVAETKSAEAPPQPVQLPPGDPRNEVIQATRYANHGEAKDLGMAKFGGAMVNVTQYGPILEGGEGHFMVDVGHTDVDGVYVWIGMEEDGKKLRWPATPEPEGFHVHCSVPRPLEDDHALWVEIRLPNGERHHGEYYIGER